MRLDKLRELLRAPEVPEKKLSAQEPRPSTRATVGRRMGGYTVVGYDQGIGEDSARFAWLIMCEACHTVHSIGELESGPRNCRKCGAEFSADSDDAP